MKRIVKVLSLALALILICGLFTGCDHIDNLRARQAFWEGDDIKYDGHLYKKLPESEVLQPNFNREIDLNITERDVPVLLSGMGDMGYASDDGYFIKYIKSTYDGTFGDELSVLYCREDKYDGIVEALNGEFKSEGLCYFYYDYEDSSHKMYKITNEQLEAIETVLERGEDSDSIAPDIYSAGLDNVVELYEYSHDGLFQKETKLALGVMNDVYYVLKVRNYAEAVDVYIASYNLQDVFEEAMKEYNSYFNYF